MGTKMLLRRIYARRKYPHIYILSISAENKYNTQKYCQHLMSTRIPANESIIIIDMENKNR